MKLSVIIVNYNVKYFLAQALQAVQKACANISAEVFVVDNVSSDGSVEMLQKPEYNWVKTIINTENVGFSRANNQAMRIATGEYILLLNPDTVVGEDSFEKIIRFMDATPDAGGLGVKMIDGGGVFLPESKRGLPTPEVAFYKIFGLSKIFPTSKKFGKYHLGYLDAAKTHEIQILSGAFMLMRNSLLQNIGLLDEKYFMYGEDIDLSYRITLAGYKNYYYPYTKIIHYKGESTQKDSLKYIITFYRAMVIFARQYFTKSNAAVFSYLINFAVVIRAAIAFISNWLRRLFSPLFDAVLAYILVYLLANFWQQNIKNTVYPPLFVQVILPIYIFIWLGSVYFSGGYDRPFSSKKMVRGIAFGTIVIAALYGFLPENLRFSRGIILAGTALVVFGMMGVRLLLQLLQAGNFDISPQNQKKMMVVGNAQSVARVLNLYAYTKPNIDFLGFVSPNISSKNAVFLGNDVWHSVGVFMPDEIVFCGNALSNNEIIQYIEALSHRKITMKIMPKSSDFIIGSHSTQYIGDAHTPDFSLNLNKPSARRNKRIVDIFGGMLMVYLCPLWVFNKNNNIGFVAILQAIIGKKTLVGYAGTAAHLPVLKPCVVSCVPLVAIKNGQVSPERADLLYAKYYSAWNDVQILIKVLFKKIT